jgi:hypothetical protein
LYLVSSLFCFGKPPLGLELLAKPNQNALPAIPPGTVQQFCLAPKATVA